MYYIVYVYAQCTWTCTCTVHAYNVHVHPVHGVCIHVQYMYIHVYLDTERTVAVVLRPVPVVGNKPTMIGVAPLLFTKTVA